MQSTLALPFNPSDDAFRLEFLQDIVPTIINSLEINQTPIWGSMTPLQMIEHLIWTFRVSTNQIEITCNIPDERRKQIQCFIYNDQQNPRNFQLPIHSEGLPSPQFTSLEPAIIALKSEIRYFIDAYQRNPTRSSIHPIMGAITLEDWSRLHFKHCFHHLMQFSLFIEKIQHIPNKQA